MSRRIAVAAFSAVAVIATAAPAAAATRYVAPTSKDAIGSCSSLKPCQLDHALANAAPGDEIVVRPGRYKVDYDLRATVPVDIHGLDVKQPPLLEGGTTANGAVLVLAGGGSISHVALSATGPVPSALEMEGGVARHITVETTGATGVTLRGSTGGAVLADSVIRTTGAAPAVRALDGGVTGPVKLLNVTAYAPDADGVAVSAEQVTAPTVVRNTIARGGHDDLVVAAGAQATADHSSLRAPSAAGYADGGSNSAAEPLFVAAAEGDLHELPESPTVDLGTAGDPDLAEVDPDGVKRALGDAPDAGAFEFIPPGTVDPIGDKPGPGDSPTGPGNGVTPPKAGRNVSVAPASGTVKVRRPDGNGFEELADGASVPVGSTVDATRGVVKLTSAVDESGATQTGSFWGGRFKVTQSADRGNYTELVLKGGDFSHCPRGGAHGKVVAAGKRRGARQLWGRDSHGRFRTRGRGGQATVRGTHWLTRDRCDGTLFKVTKGAIDVKPKKGKKHRVDAGEKFVAKLAG